MTFSIVTRKTFWGDREPPFGGETATGPSGDDAGEIAKSLLVLAGPSGLGSLRRLVEIFQSRGYPVAAARWDVVAAIMDSITSTESVGEGPAHPGTSGR